MNGTTSHAHRFEKRRLASKVRLESLPQFLEQLGEGWAVHEHLEDLQWISGIPGLDGTP
jgi:hypothetical protein